MSKAKLIEVIKLNTKTGNVILKSKFNVWYIDFNTIIHNGKNHFLGYINRVNNSTNNENEKIFNDHEMFFNALTNVLENQDISIVNEK